MKKIIFIVWLFLIIVLPSSATAHMAGQPPFFRINGVYTELYPVPISSSPEFELPQDMEKETYLVGQKLEMDLDVDQLPILPEIVDQTKFSWDFGDGETAEGMKTSHIYKKQGSYIISIYAQYQSDEPQLIQTTLINIVNNQGYQLPQANISVNDKTSQDPLTDILEIDFSQPVRFRSDLSKTSNQIVEYLWDFGDGHISREPNPIHKYEEGSMQVFPVLRIKDENGFIHDTYVQLNEAGVNEEKDFFTSSGYLNPILIGIVAILFIGGFGFWIIKKAGKK